MKVTLLNTYTDETIAYKAANICVGNKTDTNKGFKSAIESGHWSILEHLPITFLIEDVSRSLAHQFIRHRIASYSQESQRYCKIDTFYEDWYVTPKSIEQSDKTVSTQIQDFCSSDKGTFYSLDQSYAILMDDIQKLYNEYIRLGIPKEDARFILPNACKTSIIVTLNARSFIEQCSKRLCMKAQWEIREMYNLMKESIKTIYPTIYQYATAPCTQGRCIENKPCTPNRDRF